MYEKICDFAKRNNLVIAENRKSSKIAGYIVIDQNGDFHGIEVIPKDNRVEKSIPDFGPFSRVELQPNPICEKAANILDKTSKKYPYWVETMMSGTGYCDSLNAISKFIERYVSVDTFYEKVFDAYTNSGLKPDEVISFRIGSSLVEDMTDWDGWLVEKMAKFNERKFKGKSQSAEMIVSSVSGTLQESVPADSCPEIKNVSNRAKASFGIGSGVYTVALNEPSFQSYGFDGSKGTQLGIDDAKLLAAGFEKLLTDENYHNTDFKIIYMYDEDGLNNLIKDVFDLGQLDEDELDDFVENHKSLLSGILKAVYTGQTPNIVDNDSQYHMACFNVPSRARFYLSNETTGTYKELQESLYKWYSDTSFLTASDKLYVIRKVYSVLLSCISNVRSDHASKDVDAELGRLKIDLLKSIYKGEQIPELLYNRTLINFEKAVVRGDKVRTVWPSLIKCYLIRKGYEIMPELSNHGSAAYNCGRLLAVYDALYADCYFEKNRRKLEKDLSSSYLSGALSHPSVTFPLLFEKSIIHRNFIAGWKKRMYEERLGEISGLIGDTFPAKFNRDDKGCFALGFEQEKAALARLRYTSKDTVDIEVEEKVEEV